MMPLELKKKRKKARGDHAGGSSGFGRLSPVGNSYRMTQLSGPTFQTDLGDLETHQRQ